MTRTGQSLWEDTIESLEATPAIAVVALVGALVFHLGVALAQAYLGFLAFLGLPLAALMLVLVAATALGALLDRGASAAVAVLALQLVVVRIVALFLRLETTTLVVCQGVAGLAVVMGAVAWRRR